MTPEQKQQIERLQERAQKAISAALEHCEFRPLPSWGDVDFLLSLVKEQEPYTCEACGRSDEHTPECPTAAWCPGCGSRVIGHQWNTCHDAATAMRSACVEKVKERLAVLENQTRESDGIARAACQGRDSAIREIIRELESLSIEQPKE